MYDNCDGDRDVELVDPAPVLQLKRREGKRPAILIGLRDNENDSGVIKVRVLSNPSETHDSFIMGFLNHRDTPNAMLPMFRCGRGACRWRTRR